MRTPGLIETVRAASSLLGIMPLSRRTYREARTAAARRPAARRYAISTGPGSISEFDMLVSAFGRRRADLIWRAGRAHVARAIADPGEYIREGGPLS